MVRYSTVADGNDSDSEARVSAAAPLLSAHVAERARARGQERNSATSGIVGLLCLFAIAIPVTWMFTHKLHALKLDIVESFFDFDRSLIMNPTFIHSSYPTFMARIPLAQSSGINGFRVEMVPPSHNITEDNGGEVANSTFLEGSSRRRSSPVDKNTGDTRNTQCPDAHTKGCMTLPVGKSTCYYVGSTNHVDAKGSSWVNPCSGTTSKSCSALKECKEHVVGVAGVSAYQEGHTDVNCCKHVVYNQGKKHTKDHVPCSFCLAHVNNCHTARYLFCSGISGEKSNHGGWEARMWSAVALVAFVSLFLTSLSDAVSSAMPMSQLRSIQCAYETLRVITVGVVCVLYSLYSITALASGYIVFLQNCDPPCTLR